MAVYTHVSGDALRRHLAGFDLGAPVSFSGITDGIENSNYLLQTELGKFILTLFEKRIRPEDLPFCLSFMEHLAKSGVPVAPVMRDRQGNVVTPLCGRPSVITGFLEGEWPKVITPAHTAELGGLLARMHRTGESFSLERKNSLALPDWKRLIAGCGEKADGVEKGLFSALMEEADFLEKNLPHGLPRGAVHADLFPDNVFFKDGNISGVIDFYFSCTETFAYDLMLTLNAWCFDKKGASDKEKTAVLLDAYRRSRKLSPEEEAALPLFGRAAALRIIATRLYDWLHPAEGAIVTRKDPLEHVRILRFYQSGGRV